MQQHHSKGNILILVLILVAVAVVFGMLLFRSGKLNSYFGKQSNLPVSNPAAQSQDELSKGDEVEDIEKDLNTTNLSETEKVLGEVDIQLNAQ